MLAQRHQMLRRLCSGAEVHIEWKRYRPRVVKAGAPPLLLIHGVACGKDDWGVLPRIIGTRAQREVIQFDNRGIGDSSSPAGPYSISQMTADALSVVNASGARQVDVLGISLGGMIAQNLALEHRERVNALILGCTSHGGREAHAPPAEFIKLCTAWAEEHEPNASPHAEAFLRFMVPAARLEGPDGAKFFGQLKASFLETKRTCRGLGGQVSAMARFNSTRALNSLTGLPTLVVSGEADAVMPSANAESLARRIPGASHLPWDGAGHFWWAHRTADVAAVLAQFLLQHD